MQNYKIGSSFNRGTFGRIYYGVRKDTSQPVAIKQIYKEDLIDEKEHDILSKLHHPHIISLVETIEMTDCYYLILEYAPKGDLHERISSSGVVSESKARLILSQMMEAVHYLHQSGYVHCDIKPENILLFSSNRVKLADFGLVVRWTPDRLIKLNRGSPLYASPEVVFNHFVVGPSVDIWGLGTLLYFLLVGISPLYFSGLDLRESHQHFRVMGLTFRPNFSMDLRNLLSKMLQCDSEKRIKMEELLHHPWFVSSPPRKSGCQIA